MIETDEALLARWRRGEEAAFEALFLRYHGQVYRVAYGLVGSREEAEDLAQEALLTLHSRPPGELSGGGMGAWLCRIALNRGYNTLRGERRERQRVERLGGWGAAEDPQAELLRAEERSRVHVTLARLPERQAKLLLLRYSGLAYAEIAAVLDIAPGSVGTLLARAERAFLRAYQQLHPLDPPTALGTTHDTMLR